MKIEKEFVSMDPFSFEIIEGYLAYVKELQLKLGECIKNFPKKDRQLIKLILMNQKTPYDMLCSMFCAIHTYRKENGKDYSFNSSHGLLIRA
jgi:hypothetical protein